MCACAMTAAAHQLTRSLTKKTQQAENVNALIAGLWPRLAAAASEAAMAQALALLRCVCLFARVHARERDKTHKRNTLNTQHTETP